MAERTLPSIYAESPKELGDLLADPTVNTLEHERYWPIFEAMLPSTANALLDFGCGPGNFTELLAQKYSEAKILGVDAVEQLLPPSNSRVMYRPWNGQVPLPGEDRYDLITAKMVLHYLSDAELRRLAYHLLNKLEENGTVAWSVPHPVDSARFNLNKRDEWHRRNGTGVITRAIGSTGIEAVMRHRNVADWLNWIWVPMKARGLRYAPIINDAVYDTRGNPKRLNLALYSIARIDEMDGAFDRLEVLNPLEPTVLEVPADHELMTGDLSAYPVRELP